jgi:aminoglycoside phosphotransferase (APT) family kinase protein
MDPGELAEALAAHLEAATGATGLRVEGLTRLSGGASRETYAFDAVTGDRSEPMILQRERAGAVRTGGGMATEAALLRGAARAGVPVPRMVADGGDDDGLGAPFLVMGRLEGETIPRKLLRDEEFAAARPVLARECGRALAAIHHIDPGIAPDLVDQDQLGYFRSILDGLGEPHPAFELGFRWLEGNRPEGGATGVVHGDFRTGNLIVGPDGLRAVLDWELAHLGDPMEDLGWFCVRAWRFGSDQPAGGFGPYEELFAGYEEGGGDPVEPDVVRWWQALGTLKWGIMCIIQARTHLSGLSRSVELATIGRRVCENEHDLLELIR